MLFLFAYVIIVTDSLKIDVVDPLSTVVLTLLSNMTVQGEWKATSQVANKKRSKQYFLPKEIWGSTETWEEQNDETQFSAIMKLTRFKKHRQTPLIILKSSFRNP